MSWRHSPSCTALRDAYKSSLPFVTLRYFVRLCIFLAPCLLLVTLAFYIGYPQVGGTIVSMSLSDDIPLVSSLHRKGKLSWFEVVRKPYYEYLSRLPQWQTQNLPLREPLAAVGTACTLHIRTIAQVDAFPHQDEQWRSFTCRYDVDDDDDDLENGDQATSRQALFDVRELERMPIGLLTTSDSSVRCRVIAVENMLPPVMELLGSSFNMGPEVFACHAGDK